MFVFEDIQSWKVHLVKDPLLSRLIKVDFFRVDNLVLPYWNWALPQQLLCSILAQSLGLGFVLSKTIFILCDQSHIQINTIWWENPLSYGDSYQLFDFNQKSSQFCDFLSEVFVAALYK